MTTAVLPMGVLEQLARLELLSAAQLAEISATRTGEPSGPLDLGPELVRRGWLTPFQVERLLAEGAEKLVLGNYLLLDLLGEGGMGEVYKARHRRLGRVVALKAICQGQLDDLDAQVRFQREIKAVGHLDHPNIVRALDADEANGVHFYVMEYVEGTDLGKLVEQRGPLRIELACYCILQASLGLQHAHERGLVHRDIKPSNLLLTHGDNTVKLLDLGLARLDRLREKADASQTLTIAGVVIGTPDFIAPEQARDAHSADIRADLYSLGCTFYFLLTGEVPFPEGSLIEKLLKHQMDEPVPLVQRRPDTPPAVCAVVSRLMAKRPDDRYRTPAEVVDALAPLVGGVVPKPSGLVPHLVVPSANLAATPTPRVQAVHPTQIEPPSRREPTRIEKAPEPKPHRWRKPSLVVTGVAVFAGALLLAWLLKSKLIPRTSGDNPTDGVVATDTGTSARPEGAGQPPESVERAVTALKKLRVNITGAANQAESVVAADFTGLTIGEADLVYLEVLPQLEKLYLFDTAIGDGAMAHLGKLSRLEVLGLSRTQVTDDGLAPLRQLPQLQELWLNHTAITDAGLAHLERLVRLRRLHLSDTRVRNAGLRHLAGLLRLVELELRGTRVGPGLFHLRGLTELQSLDVGNTLVSDEDLAHLGGLANLRNLNLGGTSVSDKGLTRLHKLRNLQTLDLTATKVSEEGVRKLRAALTEVKVAR
jgi:serine/threonine protein kinase